MGRFRRGFEVESKEEEYVREMGRDGKRGEEMMRRRDMCFYV